MKHWPPQGDNKIDHPSTRVTGWHFEYEDNLSLREYERVLKILATSPVVSQYYCKRGTCWFNAVPGAEARRVKKEVQRLLRVSS